MLFTQKFQKKTLDKIVTWRKVKFISLKEVKKIIFIFDVAEDDSLDAVKFLSSYAKDNKIECYGLAIYLGKDNSAETILDHGIKLITKKDISKTGIPDPELVTRFLTEPSDLLIDFSRNYSFTHHYLVLSSISTFKIGRLNFDGNPYDLIITNYDDGNSAVGYIKKVFHYLNTIKPL